MSRFHWSRSIVLLPCFIVVTLPLSAQTFRGTVIDDSTSRPLDNAIIVALDSKGQELGKPAVRTDSLGRFVLHAGQPGKYQLRVTRIGYRPLTSSTIAFYGGEAVTVTLRMTVSAVKLGAVVVTDRRRMNLYELMSTTGFEARKSKGRGLFIDTLDLAQFKTFPTLWLLEDYSAGPKITVKGHIIRMQKGMGTCEPEIWIDGFVSLFPGMKLQGLGADEIYGIEVFNRLSMPPVSLGGEIGSLNPKCGAIAVWTKRFAEEMRKKGDKLPTIPLPPPDDGGSARQTQSLPKISSWPDRVAGLTDPADAAIGFEIAG